MYSNSTNKRRNIVGLKGLRPTLVNSELKNHKNPPTLRIHKPSITKRIWIGKSTQSARKSSILHARHPSFFGVGIVSLQTLASFRRYLFVLMGSSSTYILIKPNIMIIPINIKNNRIKKNLIKDNELNIKLDITLDSKSMPNIDVALLLIHRTSKI